MSVRIVELRSAMGGDDAARFCWELRRAYLRYALRQGWKAEILDESAPDASHIKSSTLRITGKHVEQLDAEAGTHRVTRIPTNERTGRRHTSAVTVAVLEPTKNIDLFLPEKDIRVETFRGTGPGGQHRNKTDSAVRITHIPTGLTATVLTGRSQYTNKERAMEVLATRVANRQLKEAFDAVRKKTRKMHGSGNIAERQRSYLWREGVAVDHQSGVRVPLKMAMEGDLAAFSR